MSRPGPEGDLSRIVQQLNQLRQTDTHTRQAEREYRSAVANYRAGLIAIVSQPDLRHLLSIDSENIPIYAWLGSINSSNRSSQLGMINFNQPIPRVLGDSVLALGLAKKPDGNYDFRLGFSISIERVNTNDNSYREETREETEKRGKIMARNLNSELSLDLTTSWTHHIPRERIPPPGSYIRFTKFVTLEDFIRHPEWLEQFGGELKSKIDNSYSWASGDLQILKQKTERLSSPSFEQVLGELRSGTQRYSNDELRVVSQDAADATLGNNPSLTLGISEERVRMIVTEMITERLAGIQFYPQGQSAPASEIDRSIRQLAPRDRETETLLKRFLSRSRDPQRVTQALMALSGLIPGAEKVRAILEAINVMFGPEERTR